MKLPVLVPPLRLVEEVPLAGLLIVLDDVDFPPSTFNIDSGVIDDDDDDE